MATMTPVMIPARAVGSPTRRRTFHSGRPSASAAHGLGQGGEEVPVDGRCPLVEQETEEEEERQDDGQGGPRRQRRHRQIDPSPRPSAHSRTCFTAPPTLQTRRRARAFTITVTANRSSPISMSAPRYKSDVASVNSFAMTLAIV